MQAGVALVARVSAYKLFIKLIKKRKSLNKNSPFQGNFAVRFGKGSVRFDTNIKN